MKARLKPHLRFWISVMFGVGRCASITSATARRRHEIRKAWLTFELETSSSPHCLPSCRPTGDATFDTDFKLLKDTRGEERGDLSHSHFWRARCQGKEASQTARRRTKRGMARFLPEIFPASIAPSSERQFVVRAQREAVGASDGRTDRPRGGQSGEERLLPPFLSVALLPSPLLSSFSFHSLRLSQLTHSHIQVMSLADAEAERTDCAAGRVVTDPLINW